MTTRLKLTIGSIAAILVANAILSLVVVQYLQGVWFHEIQTRIRLDLRSAQAAYDGHLQKIASFLEAAALDQRLVEAFARQDRAKLAAILEQLRRAGNVDMISVLDRDGRVVHRDGGSRPSGDLQTGNPLVAQAIRTRKPAQGTILLTPEQLATEGEPLAARAKVELQPTPAARPTNETVRTGGMAVAAAVPLLDENRRVVGLLYAGDLLNRRNELVDAIRQAVFPADSNPGEPVGTVTIFQGDLRIATNVTRTDGTRAVGTRLSQEVAESVLDRGEVWAAPAFVVNNWYITAYSPLRDPAGRIIGALYVGVLQAPFLERQNTITVMVLVMVLVATVCSLLLVLLLTELVLRPVHQIVAMARRVVGGDLSARVGVRPPGEIGVLCQAIDQMADVVVQREQELKALTRQQIGRSEKLASLGRLAAGVAHEINNPLTGVLTFAHLMREKSNMDDQDREDLDLIIRETTRAAEIVRGLLDFARERATIKEPLSINDVVQRTIRLIRNQKLYDRIEIREELSNDLPDVEGDMNQLQQVMLNLALNGCEAMPQGGVLTIYTQVVDDRVLLRISDTGCGIPRELYDKIFEPFFTTKPVGKGTGLGLSVTYGIVQQHGGTLEFESEENLGTTFLITLPAHGSEPVQAGAESAKTSWG